MLVDEMGIHIKNKKGMNKEQIKTEADFRQYIMQLLKIKDEESSRGNNVYSPLLDNLLSLWTATELYKNRVRLTFMLIVEMMEQAFTAPKKTS